MKKINFKNYKKFFVQVMIGSLIAAASVAVIAVLIGEFSDTIAKSIWSLVMVILHALISLSFIDTNEKRDYLRKLQKSNETLFALLIMSFFTSVLGIWEILPGDIVSKLYGSYLVVLVSSYHAESLTIAMGKEKKTDLIAKANFVFIAGVAAMMFMFTWAPDADYPDFIYRLLTAIGIVDITLTVLVVIYYKLYMQKHPEEKPKAAVVYDSQGNAIEVTAKQRGLPTILRVILWIIVLYLLFSLLASILIFSAFN